MKKAYFSDLDGSNIVEFQFTPSELTFSEGSNIKDRVYSGSNYNDSLWLSGKASDFKLRFFINRTFASYSREEMISREGEVVKINNVNSSYAQQANNLQLAIAETLPSLNTTILPSQRSATPHYVQTTVTEQEGVYPDLLKLLRYVYAGDISPNNINTSDDISSFTSSRFTPPPKIIFMYGNLWKEGYVTNIKYKLSAVDSDLIPRRLDSEISISVSKSGIIKNLI